MDHSFSTPAVKNQAALTELERFFGLSVALNKSLTMFSEYIDDAWHSLMEEPARYNEFCIKAAGRSIGHIPNEANSPMVDVEWLREYEARYGKLALSWFADASGRVNRSLYDVYMKTGEIRTNWDCVPSSGTNGE